MNRMKRFASIDIGSNTVLLLIADVNTLTNEIRTIANFYEAPRISAGIKETGYINSESREKLFSVLGKYSKLIEEYNCNYTILTATNAFRIAQNAKDIIAEVKNKFGFEIDIIPGKEEARYSFLGATYDLTSPAEKLVIDIGGGSTEVIFGSNENISYVQSFNFGVVSITERFIDDYPVKDSSIREIMSYITDKFAELKEKILSSPYSIAVAGAPTTLSCIKQSLKFYDEQKVEKSILTIDELLKISDELKKLLPDEIRKKYGSVVEGREDVLLTGTLILLSFAKLMDVNRFIVSGKGIRYGAIINYLMQIENQNN